MEERLVVLNHLTCSPTLGQMHAIRVSTPTASQQGHATATLSSIPMYEARSNVHEIWCEYVKERVSWPRAKSSRGSCFF